MTAQINYRVYKTRPMDDPDDAPMRWVLIRTGAVSSENGGDAGFLPEADAAVFCSENECNLFCAWLDELRQKAKAK